MDLHVHTTASDGELSPKEVVEMAAAAGVTTLAITDHDTVDGLAEALLWGDRLNSCVIPGIEINAQHEAELHILGYGLDAAHPALLEACAWFRAGRAARGERILAYLQDHGMTLSLEEVRRFARGNQLGRPHFARAMVEKGYVASVEEAFAQYLTGAAFADIEREKLSPETVIKLIRHCGGVAVLAHPASLALDEEALARYVQELADYGLEGMECFYSSHSPNWTTVCLEIAQRLGLKVTGGTDFHGGQTKRGVAIGTGRGQNMLFDDETIVQWLRENTFWGQKGQMASR